MYLIKETKPDLKGRRIAILAQRQAGMTCSVFPRAQAEELH